METHNNFDQQFEFTGKAKTLSIAAIVIGLIIIVLGFVTNHAERTFANMLLMAYYFACVCMAGIFFCAIQYVAQAGWAISLLRVPQALARTLPVAAVVLIAVILAGLFCTHPIINEEGKQVIAPYLYKLWAIKDVAVKGTENYDPEIATKAGYLNLPFFLTRVIGFLVIYSFFGWLLNKYSTNEDQIGGVSNYRKSFNTAAIFLTIFGFTAPVFSFDVVMSLEAKWFSTMFGWYNFAAMWVSGLATMTLVIILLRKQGYFSWVTTDHLHNFGQLIFGFSIFWTYTWFAQFLLTYYANIPEEAVYFYRRWEPEFKPWFWINLVMNFALPILILMSRDSKRVTNVLKWACIIVLAGHWLDYFVMIMPGSAGPQGAWYLEISWIEIGVAVGFVGLFTFSLLTSLSKFKALAPKNHPFLGESLHHHI
ncbi:quinol:cytochrome C oxidoreductase [Mucilaginibacter sp. AW1-3]